MANASDVYSGPFLTAEYVKSRGLVGYGLRVTFVEQQAVGRAEKMKQKLVLTLAGAEKPLVLNKTNAMLCIAAWGDDYEKWQGMFMKLKLGMAMNPEGVMVPSIQVDPQVPGSSSTLPAPSGARDCTSPTFPVRTEPAGLDALELI